jgi:hypothetical protein
MHSSLNYLYIVTYITDCRRGFGLIIRFIEHLQITVAQSPIHTLYSSLQHLLSFSLYCVFTSRYLVTASNAINPSTSVFTASNARWLSPHSRAELTIFKLPNSQLSHSPTSSIHFIAVSSTTLRADPRKTPLPTVLPLLLAGRCLARAPVVLPSNDRCLACFAIVA